MSLITIREHANNTTGPNAAVSIDGQTYPITLRHPFSEAEEEQLEWYFEQYIRLPLLDQVKAKGVEASITIYGEMLFGQVFANPTAYAHYRERLQQGVDTLTFEIIGSPEFHGLHWEALKDPVLPQAFTLLTTLVRRNPVLPPLPALVHSSPTLNLLLVVARPDRSRDAGYRTVSRPLVERLRQANLPVQVDIVRPGTYQALVHHLEEIRDGRSTGHYHLIHFDLHGTLLTYEALQQEFKADHFLAQSRYGRGQVEPYQGWKAFLLFEGDKVGRADPVEAGELANLLLSHQIPIAILNACQSGKQVGANETSLGSRLMQAGTQVTLTMGYSITVSAAELFMQAFYTQLLAGRDLLTSVRRARLELYHHKARQAYFNQTIELEDWLLPVVYSVETPPALQVRPFTSQERVAYYDRQASRYRSPEPAYGFIGRDLDILRVEKRLLTQCNMLLVRGMGGVGKSTLLHHLGTWWQTTGLIDQVFYFGYDERAWTRQQIIIEVAQRLLGETRYYAEFQPLSLAAQQAMLGARLRAERHLLILDNLESITGVHLAIQNTLPPAERLALQNFLADLAGGQTLILLGSRGSEGWLVKQGRRVIAEVYELPGLDPEAASVLADRILVRHQATRYRQDGDLQKLLKLLDGYPLPLEVVLANLARQTPADVLMDLEAGAVDLDSDDAQTKTESILRCIDYSHSNLSPEAQGLLACLAPFTSVINTRFMEQYTAQLRQQPVLAHLPFDRWPEVLQEAQNWGLLKPHRLPGFLRLQPILPYFLRSRLNSPTQLEARQAIEIAFRQYCNGLAGALDDLLKSTKATEQQLGQTMVSLEYENLSMALNLGLTAQLSIINPYTALSRYLDAVQDHRRGLELGQTVLTQLEAYPADQTTGLFGLELVSVRDDIARRHLSLKQYSTARVLYQQTLDLVIRLETIDPASRNQMTASICHQLGMVAEAQGTWERARQYYQQALAFRAEGHNRHAQAPTYHQLGRVAEAQRQWKQARQHYQQALEIFTEYNDRYNQAKVYHQLGVIAEAQRQWHEAEQHYHQALQIFSEYNDRYQQAAVYRQLGTVAQARREWVQAEQYYRQTLEILIEYNDRQAQADTYNALGIMAQEQSLWPQANQYYGQALEIKQEYQDPDAQAAVYHNLGMVAQAQQQWLEAEQYYRQALAIKLASNDRYAQASTYCQLGLVAQAQQNWAEAEQYYRQALAIQNEYDDRPGLANIYGQLGLLAQAQQQWPQAQAYLLQALEIFHHIDDEQNTTITLYSLARLWQTIKNADLVASIASTLGIIPEEVEKRLLAYNLTSAGTDI